MKILITGDRKYDNIPLIEQSFQVIATNCDIKTSVVIHGACSGADILAGNCAEKLGYKIDARPADWKKYGRSAGPIRNLEMINEEPDIILIFHNNLKESKGTKHCVTAILTKIEKTKNFTKKNFNPILLLNSEIISSEELKKKLI